MTGKRSNIKIMIELIKLLRPLIWAMMLAVIAGVTGFLIAFALGIIGGYALLSSIPSMAESLQSLPFGSYDVYTYFTALIICALLRGILHYAEQFCNHYIAFKILAQIRSRIFTAMRRLAPAKLDGKNQGQLVSLIMGDIELLEVFYAHTISPIAIALISSVLLFIFFFSLHPLFAVLALLAQLVIGVIMPVIASKKGNNISSFIRKEIGELNGQFLDKLRGIKEIIAFQQGDAVISEIDQATEYLGKQQKVLKKQGAAVIAGTDSLIMIFTVLQIISGIYLLRSGQVSAVAVFIAAITQVSTFAPFVNLATLGNTLTQTFACGQRVLDLLEEEPYTPDIFNGKNVDFGDINGKTVSFSYPDSFISESSTEDFENKAVIRDIDFSIKEGEMLGIMGESGCGKSTLLKLIMRFWKPEKNCIKLNGSDLEEINTNSLYSHINFMTQNTVLFTGTLRENLLIAKQNATEEELWLALRKAALNDYVMNLPDCLDTEVGEGGSNFSGGERQRIGLARCFLADRNLFLLDEPTSNLDSWNEAVILRALAKEAKGKTVVIVSHRASTLGVCQRVLNMRDGKFVS